MKQAERLPQLTALREFLGHCTSRGNTEAELSEPPNLRKYRILNAVKIYLKTKTNKDFSDIQNLEEFITSKRAL